MAERPFKREVQGLHLGQRDVPWRGDPCRRQGSPASRAIRGVPHPCTLMNAERDRIQQPVHPHHRDSVAPHSRRAGPGRVPLGTEQILKSALAYGLSIPHQTDPRLHPGCSIFAAQFSLPNLRKPGPQTVKGEETPTLLPEPPPTASCWCEGLLATAILGRHPELRMEPSTRDPGRGRYRAPVPSLLQSSSRERSHRQQAALGAKAGSARLPPIYVYRLVC